MGYMIKTLKISVCPKDDNPIFGEKATHITIDDEAAGPFIVLKQSFVHAKPGEVRLDPDEMRHVFEHAQKLLDEYNKEA